MNKCRMFLFVSVFVTAGVGCFGGEIVDPASSSQWRELQAGQNRTLSRWLPKRIKQLDAERENLLRKISILPTHEPRRLPDHLGYHSATVEPDENGDGFIDPAEFKAKGECVKPSLFWAHNIELPE